MNRRNRLLSFLTLTFLIGLATAIGAAEGNPVQPAPSIAELVADLNSDHYAVREQATRLLLDSGHDAVAPLAAAAEEESLEVSIRAIRILQELYAGSDDGKTIDAAEIALESLAESTNRSAASRAGNVLAMYYELREERALVQIERLGGVVSYIEPENRQLNGNNIQLRINGNVVEPGERRVGYILLGRKWKGGDEGVKYIKRLSQLGILYVSGTGESAPISKKARQDLQAAMPNLRIEPRGAAFLGIGGGPHPRGCQVHRVQEGTAADKGGLREFDVIIGFGDKKIETFEALIEHIKQFDPGDKVKVKVLRGAEELTLDVVMGEWK